MQEDIKFRNKTGSRQDVCSCGFNLEKGSRVKISHTEVNVLLRGRRYRWEIAGDKMIARVCTLHLIWHRYRWRSAESHVHRHTARRHSVGHCNFTDTLARAIGTGVCTGLCKQAHPAGVITPLRVIDNVRARGKERESERAKENETETRKERRERRENRDERKRSTRIAMFR